uniref:Uncharacterized protein n=1 Tax=Strigamia maritima TaxID=126957 RepID=T1J8G3_STRMM
MLDSHLAETRAENSLLQTILSAENLETRFVLCTHYIFNAVFFLPTATSIFCTTILHRETITPLMTMCGLVVSRNTKGKLSNFTNKSHLTALYLESPLTATNHSSSGCSGTAITPFTFININKPATSSFIHEENNMKREIDVYCFIFYKVGSRNSQFLSQPVFIYNFVAILEF